jgi:hypothetical protein
MRVSNRLHELATSERLLHRMSAKPAAERLFFTADSSNIAIDNFIGFEMSGRGDAAEEQRRCLFSAMKN